MRPRQHGTYAGYKTHQRYHEQPCTPCCDAAAQYVQDRRLAPFRRRQLLAALAGYDLYTNGDRHDTTRLPSLAPRPVPSPRHP